MAGFSGGGGPKTCGDGSRATKERRAAPAGRTSGERYESGGSRGRVRGRGRRSGSGGLCAREVQEGDRVVDVLHALLRAFHGPGVLRLALGLLDELLEDTLRLRERGDRRVFAAAA